jgi:hypothetical protein
MRKVCSRDTCVLQRASCGGGGWGTRVWTCVHVHDFRCVLIGEGLYTVNHALPELRVRQLPAQQGCTSVGVYERGA